LAGSFNQSHQRKTGDRLSAAGFAHDPQRFPFSDVVRDIVDGLKSAGFAEESRFQIFYTDYDVAQSCPLKNLTENLTEKKSPSELTEGGLKGKGNSSKWPKIFLSRPLKIGAFLNF
jgi:hypothetical protein